jgi:hypothetical protein
LPNSFLPNFRVLNVKRCFSLLSSIPFFKDVLVSAPPSNRDLRVLRRFTWTTRNGLEQYDKLRAVFEAAAFAEDYFCNSALVDARIRLDNKPEQVIGFPVSRMQGFRGTKA